MLIYIYSRKSVYTGKGESIENQIELCRQYIRLHISDSDGATILVYEDEGYSGKNLERPQFKKMMEDSRKTKPDYLFCYRLDRISRSVSDFAPLIEELNNRGIAFICIKEKFDTSTPMGKAMLYIASVFAQLERETIAERVRDNMMMLARTGRWLGGTTPTGFACEKIEEVLIDGKLKASCMLTVHPEEIKIVKTIFDQFLALHSVSGVSKYLIRNQIKSRAGTFFSLLGIKEILQNPVYCTADEDALSYFRRQNADVCFAENTCSDKRGLLSYNKRDYTKKSAPRLSMDQWIIAVGKHRGIIPGKQWVMIQHILSGRKPDRHEGRIKSDYALLSGMIYCSACKSKMFSKSRSNNPELFDYMCGSKIQGGKSLCPCPNLNGKQADGMVMRWLQDNAQETTGIYKCLEALKREMSGQQQEDPLKRMEDQISRCTAEIDSLEKLLLQHGIAQTLFERINSRVKELDEALRSLNEERASLKRDQEHTQDQTAQLEVIAHSVSSLEDFFHDLTVHEKRSLIRLLIRRMEWDGQELHVCIHDKKAVHSI